METIVVEFGSSSDFCVLELDGYSHLDDEGNERSQVYTDEEAVLRLHHDASYRVMEVVPVKGSITSMGQASRTITEEKYFPEPLVDDGETRTGELTLQYIPAGSVAVEWDGREGSGFVVDGRKVSVTGGYPCACTLTYAVSFALYRHTPPSMDLADGESTQINVAAYLEPIT